MPLLSTNQQYHSNEVLTSHILWPRILYTQ